MLACFGFWAQQIAFKPLFRRGSFGFVKGFSGFGKGSIFVCRKTIEVESRIKIIFHLVTEVDLDFMSKYCDINLLRARLS